MKVKDAMTVDVLTVAPDMPLKQAAALMADYAIGGLPVVDREGTLLGVMTEADILLKERAEQPRGWRSLFHRDQAHAMMSKIAARTVGDAMTAPATTVDPRLSVGSAADIMVEHGINRLPVLDGGQLVGIITRHDLVHAFARSDTEIERDIREEALSGLVTIPELIRLRVENGEVSVGGEVDSSYDAAAIPDLIRRIPGVVTVDSQLHAWDPDRKEKVLVTIHRD